MLGPLTYGALSQNTVDQDAAAIIAAMTSEPNAARQSLINTTVLELKSAGVWSLLDTLWVMAAHHEQAGRLNWKSPGNFTLTTGGTITHTIDQGWQGNGSTGYLNTGWIPSTNGVNYTLDNASFGAYSRTDTSGNVYDISAMTAAGTDRTQLSMRWSDGSHYGAINNGAATVGVAIANSLGLGAMRRTASNAMQLYRNGAQSTTSTAVSTALGSLAMYIAARNLNNAANGFSTRQYALAFTGAAMSEAQQASLYSVFQTGYLSDIGAAV